MVGSKGPSSLIKSMNYPLVLRSGGQGTAFDISTGGVAVTKAVAGLTPGTVVTVHNEGSSEDTIRFVLLTSGDGSADNAGTPVEPGDKEVFSVPEDGQTYTHISIITRSDPAYATVNTYDAGS